MGGAASVQEGERRRRFPAALAMKLFFPCGLENAQIAGDQSAVLDEHNETVGELPGPQRPGQSQFRTQRSSSAQGNRRSGGGLPPRVPGTPSMPINPAMAGSGELGIIIGTPALTRLDTGLDHTPAGSEADSYRFYCPLCMNYFKETYETSCCKNYLCQVCLGAFLKGKGVPVGVDRGGALTFGRAAAAAAG
eukprot:CAMPEP_0194664208 /NCGR_PEP_ID=MMETSP0295-20121207/1316_1 /TAXON_ID=39354 /ORGANISM="Heterosigma akashiwo, Strain CCMP2393" /LENGTH=191 /DNA_ID=CAMNT_0039545889 /DNA_START=47 /DNA_END=618 /DNA_ORIENTATION=+